jgi:hypothetical protein
MLSKVRLALDKVPHGKLPAWAPVFAIVASINLPLLLVLTGIAGLGVVWHGWVAGARPAAPRSAATV